MDNEYECVMINPPEPKLLKSQVVTLVYQPYIIEGFSIDEEGNEVKNGIEFQFNKLIRIEHPKE